MVVDDFDVVGVPAGPTETDTPLVIDADAVLSSAIASQLFEAVRGWNAKVDETGRGVEHEELPESGWLEIG